MENNHSKEHISSYGVLTKMEGSHLTRRREGGGGETKNTKRDHSDGTTMLGRNTRLLNVLDKNTDIYKAKKTNAG